MFRTDIISYLVYIAIAFAGIFWAIPAWSPEYVGYGIPSTTCPNILCWAIVALSALGLVETLRKRPAEKSDLSPKIVFWFAACLAPILISMPAMQHLGFFAGGFIVMFMLCRCFGQSGFVLPAACSVLTVCACYVLFWSALKIPLP